MEHIRSLFRQKTVSEDYVRSRVARGMHCIMRRFGGDNARKKLIDNRSKIHVLHRSPLLIVTGCTEYAVACKEAGIEDPYGIEAVEWGLYPIVHPPEGISGFVWSGASIVLGIQHVHYVDAEKLSAAWRKMLEQLASYA